MDNTEILEVVNKMDRENDGLLGFTIAQAIEEPDNGYETIGSSVISVFEKYPESANILDEMLIAVTGYSIKTLIQERMSEEENTYDAL